MAAYAALTSLMNLIDQLDHHPLPPVTLDKEQTQSLTENIVFLQDFLEAYNLHYSNQEVERLRIRIADAAYAAEDVIESYISDRILARSPSEEVIESPMSNEVIGRRTDNDNKVKQYFGFCETKCNSRSQSTSYGEKTSSADLYQSQQKAISETTSTHDDADKICSYLYQGLQKALEEMDLVKKDVEKIKGKLGTQEQLQGIITTPLVSPESHSTQRNIMVGFDDVLNELLHKLTGQPHSDRQIIPISGMGGIGKTTLAKNLYTHPLVEHHFDILAWVTISQEFKMREILKEALCQTDPGSRESLSTILYEAELGEMLYKSLYGRRYLIVIDDMWSNDAWDKIKIYFPRNNQGSKIIVTTRLSNVASYLSSGCVHEMGFLDQDKSWSLFCKIVFGEKDWPLELEDIGMDIVRNCKGLPLSIVVLGGFLAKSNPTREYWAHILQNVSSIVNLEESKRYFKILHTSYDELPVHLKACFLYMAIFPEDSEIRVSSLISMWVAEGFLKPMGGKSLEESGEKYLMDLIDRNLILVDESGYSEKVKICKIHDLLRYLCIREAQKEKFIFSANQHDHEGINTQRRIVIDKNISNKEYLQNLQSISTARSLICYSGGALPAFERRLLRVFKSSCIYREEDPGWGDTFQQVNSRFLLVQCYGQFPILPISASLLWNLQTLIISQWERDVVMLPEIWKLPLLRHVECECVEFSDPPSCDTDEFVLHNLHRLMGVENLKLSEDVVKRIPNVKKLRLRYEKVALEYYCLNNLHTLHKLEYLHCRLPSRDDLLPNLIFPLSLKELCLVNTRLSWEDINTKIGSLPHLQALKLLRVSFTTSAWETIQGQFCSLEYLRIYECGDWEHWGAESSHFPRLQHLLLDHVYELKEIPCDIGNIPTLESIQLRECRYSAIKSAKQIAEEQGELGNEGLRVTVTLYKHHREQEDYEAAESLASHNFQVKFKNSS